MLYDWKIIQFEYDLGLSQRDICKKFKISSGAIHNAVKRGDLVCRPRDVATKLAKTNGKGHLSDRGRQRLSEIARKNILNRYEQGWQPRAGRCKKITYTSPVAGTVFLDGTWELKVAEWLDKQNYKWIRNTKRFQYTNLKGSISHYTPDFWVDEFNAYLEVKGYETSLDRCKWSQFNEPLLVWKKNKLQELKLI